MLRLLISNPSFLRIHTHLVKSNSLISFPIVVPRHDKLRRGWGRRGNKNENSCYDEMRENRRTNPVFVLGFGWKMVGQRQCNLVSPFRRLSPPRLPHCTRCPPHGVKKSGRLSTGEKRGGKGTGLYCRAIYTAFSPATDTLNPFSRRGVARPGEQSLFITALNSTRSRALL